MGIAVDGGAMAEGSTAPVTYYVNLTPTETKRSPAWRNMK